jgi:hypothetical protein
MAFTMIVITATLNGPDGQPSNGTLVCTLSDTITNATTILAAGPVSGIVTNGELLDDDGYSAFTVAAVDDTGTTPEGATYLFEFTLDNLDLPPFTATVSHAAPGGSVDVSELIA